MKSIALLVVGSTLFLQASHTSPQLAPRELLDARRPLTDAEIASVLGAARDAVAGKAFRLYAGGMAPGPEVLMRGDGELARLRTSYEMVGGHVDASGQSARWSEETTKIVDYTNRPARQCPGATGSGAAGSGTAGRGSTASDGETGELVIEYTRSRRTPGDQPSGWSVAARRRVAGETGMPGLMPVFEMLRGNAGGGADNNLASGEEHLRRIRDRRARGFAARFVPPRAGGGLRSSPRLIGDPRPDVMGEPPPRDESMPMQTLWIDAESLLPLRWEATDRGRGLQHFDFLVEPIDMRLPAELATLAVPDCIR